jgi:hypothetical protein
MELFDPKDPTEIIPLTFDFSVELAAAQTIQGTPTVAVTVYSGTDASPGAILSGAATVLGARVRQNVQGGLVDVQYLIKVTATTNTGLKYTIGRILPVKSSGTY